MKKTLEFIGFIIAMGMVVVICENHLWSRVKWREEGMMTIANESYRAEFFSNEMRNNKDKYSDVCKRFLHNVEKDVSYFPVAESTVDKSYKTIYVNSWMSERSFGGKRTHEGCDIMAGLNVSGVYPVVSMSDGIVTNIGWLDTGGYRIGITSDSGIYYYYAHLDTYGNITQGQRVQAGDFLGYMGNTGYGPEGTKGRFDVHLHVGIYGYEDGKEISVNPYYVLCFLENKKLKYAYS